MKQQGQVQKESPLAPRHSHPCTKHTHAYTHTGTPTQTNTCTYMYTDKSTRTHLQAQVYPGASCRVSLRLHVPTPESPRRPPRPDPAYLRCARTVFSNTHTLHLGTRAHKHTYTKTHIHMHLHEHKYTHLHAHTDVHTSRPRCTRAPAAGCPPACTRPAWSRPAGCLTGTRRA